jgi:hypothetical protein
MRGILDSLWLSTVEINLLGNLLGQWEDQILYNIIVYPLVFVRHFETKLYISSI